MSCAPHLCPLLRSVPIDPLMRPNSPICPVFGSPPSHRIAGTWCRTDTQVRPFPCQRTATGPAMVLCGVDGDGHRPGCTFQPSSGGPYPVRVNT